MESVGVRELGRDAPALLARIQTTGLGIEITDHGRPVARLIPIRSGVARSREQLVDQGMADAAHGYGLPTMSPR